MSKALWGHLPNVADLHLVEDNARLRARVQELQGELAELKHAMSSAELHNELHLLTAVETPAL